MPKTSDRGGGGGGGIGGTINTGQIAFASALDTIAGTNNIKWDDTNSKIDLTGRTNFLSTVEYVVDYGHQLVGTTGIQWIPTGGLNFKYASTGPGGDRFRFTASGSLGLGTNPSYKLDVNGDFRCVGDANLNANAIISGETSFISSTEAVVSFGQQLVGTTAVQWIPSTGLHFKYNATGLGGFLVSVTSAGNVGIGTTTPNSKLAVVGLPVFADNASAITGGLSVGDFYRTGADPDPVCVVH